ncbi:unnamed protein product [Arctia plantaginis]|uniref:Cilia- and flagella-associated protein 61 N-terminal domain-containing protein n=1 Tax=Arctia plantaginis TaxID=874455 RepID=A0A8S1AGP9_ARCPL|nr:unnamed protein product [Arctia plantaginis]
MFSRTSSKPAIGRVRFATVEDASLILELVNEPVEKTFRVGCVNDIIYLIENSILALCQLDILETIIGFLSARDYPMIPSVHPAAWERYIWNKYKSTEMNSRNSLFLHMLCWNTSYSRDVVDSMLKSIFMHDPYVHHIGMVKSVPQYPLLVPGQTRSEASFRRVQVIERGVVADKLPALYIADRVEVSPRLRIRRAVEEDNDDLVPILERHAPQLQALYGEFYISELISRHPESDRVLLVCEHKELAVGMMCLNTMVNYEALEENFVLTPFAGLKHLSDEHEQYDKTLSEDSNSSLHITQESQDFCKAKDAELRVTIADDVKDHLRRDSWHITRQISLMGNNPDEIMNILLEDEESAPDYDIVNINTEWMWVPEFLCNALSGATEAIQKIINDNTPPKPKNKKDHLHKMGASSTSTRFPEPVRFQGKPNAFLIELYAMQSDYDERYGFDILEATYELFPDRDYCIICLPSNQSPCPLLEHFTLVTPMESANMRFKNDSLYVAHVNSVRGNMRVRWGEKQDINTLERILGNAPNFETLMNLYKSTLPSPILESFIFLSENQPIGMVVIGPLEDSTTVRAQYDLEPEPRRPGTDGAILAGVMSPALEPHTRWFLRELLRQSRYSTLFWICRLFARGDEAPSRNLMSLASYMNPVHPRRSVPNISQNKDLDRIFRDIACPFALWMLEKPLTALPKVFVNNSIVVVGASRTGLSFLEALLMGPTSEYLTFSNLTLVSEHGLPTVSDCLKAADICVPRDGRYTDRYIKSVPFYYYVDVMSAVMVGIDRKRKFILLKDGSTKYYDELVLTCGEQFQHPEYLKDALNLVKEVKKGKPCDRILMDNPSYQEDRVPPPPELPVNVFLINSLYEANLTLGKLMRLTREIKLEDYQISEENRVVVYGDCVQAYSCIAALLELGILSKFIVFVEPFPDLEEPTALRVNCFNDETVDERVQAKLGQLGIQVLRQCRFDSWKMEGEYVDSLNLMTPLHALTIKCFALFYFGLQAINMHAFKAINESGLVYDGGLVVSPTFETNDHHIYGAGTCCSYSRRLYATRGLHRNYCSEDIGEALARLFLRKLDPFVMRGDSVTIAPSDLLPSVTSSILGVTSPTASSCTRLRNESSAFRRWQPVMKFKSPLVLSATLPGPLYYMKVRKCGKEIPMAVQKLLPHQGHTLITDHNGNYFRLQLNVLHIVEGITCLSKKPFSSEILSQLFGKHEAVFNKLLTRYMRGEIKDFYEYFTQPWMSALYQETFEDLVEAVNEQDVYTVSELTKSKFISYADLNATKSSCASSSMSSDYESNLNKDFNEGTFRPVFERLIAKASPIDVKEGCKGCPVDIPEECGQDNKRHKDALKIWKRLSGERIISAHLAKYLDRNSVCNPHYAAPKPDFQYDD